MGLAIADLEGKYEIVAKLKEGGMGAIYKVRHRLLEELRVVKVLRSQHQGDEELRLRLAREARAAIRLRHPNVVQIFDFSLDDTGAGLIIMEYIHGSDLSYLLKESHRPSLALILEIARQSLRALGFLHRQGFVHRDVSPDNLMLTVDVEGDPLVKLIDLGIAKNHDAEQNLTVTGSFLGKFRYASPEHFGAMGPDGTEARSDLYTFGLVLYELLTGCYPMPGESTSQLIAAHLFQPPLKFAETDPEGKIPEAVRQMVMRSLEKKAEDRFADAKAWVEQIEKLQKDFPLTTAELEEAVRLGQPPKAWSQPDSGDTQWDFGQLFGDPDPSAYPPGDTEGSDRDRGASAGAESGASSADGGNALDVLLAGAQALLELGEPDQARRQAQTILNLDSEHPGALQLLEQLDKPTASGSEDDEDSSELAVPEPPPTQDLPVVPPVFSSTGSSQIATPESVQSNEPVPSEAVVRFDALLKSDRLVEADQLLSELIGTHGQEPPLPDMRQRLDDRFQEQLAQKIRQLLDEAESQVEAGDYSQALVRLREAQTLTPAKGPLHDELTQGVLHLQRKIEARERRKKIDRMEQRVLKLLRTGKLEEARDKLDRAREKLGDDDVFHSLTQILERAVHDRQNELGSEAGRALELGRYNTAIRCLDEMLGLDPNNSWIRSQLERAHKLRQEAEQEEDLRRREDDERRTDFESLAAMVTGGELEEAHRMLGILAQRWGEAIAKPWRQRLDEQRRAGAQRLLNEAEQSRVDGDLFKARLLVAEASRLDPDDSAISHFARMLDSTVKKELPDDLIPLDDQSGVLHTIAEIERLRVEGQPLRAWKALQQAVEHFGERSELAHLRKELAEQILEESGGAL